jgi:sulfur-carrier protein
MKIQIRLFASFRIGRFKTQVREYPEGTDVLCVVLDLGLPEKDLGIILINGKHASQNQILCNGDILSLLPLVGGG